MMHLSMKFLFLLLLLFNRSTIPSLPRSPYYVFLQSKKEEMMKLYPSIFIYLYIND